MDEFIDDLLHLDRVCDTILPRLTQRYILEDADELEPRISPLEDELDAMMDEEEEEDIAESKYNDIVEIKDNDIVESKDEEMPQVKVTEVEIGEPKKKVWSKKKVKSLFKTTKIAPKLKDVEADEGGAGGDASMTIAESNRLRASLGLAPLE